MSTTAFAGVAPEPERGVSRRGGLYEFWTDKGEHIYLHDTDLVSVEHAPGPPAVLTLRFQYDRAWTPPELVGKPLVVFRFEDVRVDAWEEDDEAFADLTRNPEVASAAGQVSNFDWNGQDYFGLNTFLMHLTFTAQHLGRVSVFIAAT